MREKSYLYTQLVSPKYPKNILEVKTFHQWNVKKVSKNLNQELWYRYLKTEVSIPTGLSSYGSNRCRYLCFEVSIPFLQNLQVLTACLIRLLTAPKTFRYFFTWSSRLDEGVPCELGPSDALEGHPRCPFFASLALARSFGTRFSEHPLRLLSCL